MISYDCVISQYYNGLWYDNWDSYAYVVMTCIATDCMSYFIYSAVVKKGD